MIKQALIAMALLAIPAVGQDAAPVESRISYELQINPAILDSFEAGSSIDREIFQAAKMLLCATGCRWANMCGALVIDAPDDMIAQLLPESRVTLIKIPYRQIVNTVKSDGNYVGDLAVDAVTFAHQTGYNVYLACMDDYTPRKPIPLAMVTSGKPKVEFTIVGGVVTKAVVTEREF